MGIKSWLRLDEPAPVRRYAADIPPEFYGLSSYSSLVSPVGRIDRRTAIQVGGVKRARDLVCSAIGGLPIRTYNAQRQVIAHPLLEQPERNVPKSVTMTRLLEDLYFEEVAWWRITEWTGAAPYNFPLHVTRLDPRSVDLKKTPGKIWYSRSGALQGESDGEYIDDDQLIRFDSPTDGLLIAGARAIRTCLMLDNRAYLSADNPTPAGYFTPVDGADPFEDEPDDDATDEEKERAYTAKKWLAEYAAARRESPTDAYVPAGLDYKQLQWDPEKLQLSQAREQAVVELSRHAGVDTEDLGVSTTSRTYFNAETKRRDRLDFTLAQFLKAVEDRLSMGDVTPRGQYVRFVLDGFLRTDTVARYQAYREGKDLGILTVPEIRALEDLPPLPEESPAASPADTEPEEETVDNVRPIAASAHRAVALNADLPLALTLDADQTAQSFSVDTETRTIRAIVIPYGKVAEKGGHKFTFTQGSIELPEIASRAKFLRQHDPLTAFGHALTFEDTPEALKVAMKVGRGPEGDLALMQAEDGIWDGISAGLGKGEFTLKDGVNHAKRVPLLEVSLTPNPAFTDSRVTSVALSADTEGNTMKCTKCGAIHAAGVVECDPTTLAQFTADNNGKVSIDPKQFSQDLAAALGPEMAKLFTAAVQQSAPPTRDQVSATGQAMAANLSVTEELPYRFNGSEAGEHLFTNDLREAHTGNADAKNRLDKFLAEAHTQFAVTTGNVAAFNPVQNRPEMYVGSLAYKRPLWDLASTGVLQGITAFTIPKFVAAAGLVGQHTQGVEPTPGSFSATTQTVQPVAISGKVEINREAWDQGGNPQTDTIIWREMQQAYWENAEERIATVLNAIAAANLYTGQEINFGGAVDSALDDEYTDLFADLQYVRGGDRFTSFAADGALYKATVKAADTAGRPLYPRLGPSNANGQVAARLRSVDVQGQQIYPAWALGSAVDDNSYLFVPESVWAWMSAPKRFTFEYQVKSVDMAVWGYAAAAVIREADVARIDYTTADV